MSSASLRSSRWPKPQAIGYSPCTESSALAATTYGVGGLMLRAVRAGAKTIYIGLGGSATNDGGAGMLQALGAAPCR